MRMKQRLLTVLALTATLLAAHAQQPKGGTSSANLVISKVFYNNMVNDAKKAFILANFLELYNNSDQTLDVTGVYIGFCDNTSTTAKDFPYAWTAANMEQEHKDSIALKQIFRIPTDKQFLLAPGQSIVVCNSALNHTTVASKAPDLSKADFEVKSLLSTYKDNHNDQVPELPQVFSYNDNSTYIQWMSPGPFGVVLLEADTDLDNCPTGLYMSPSESTSLYKFVPAAKTIDAADFVEHSAKTGPDASQKRIPSAYDAGFIATNCAGGNGGEALVRKVASTASDGRVILADTNNSSNDFEVTTDLSIRSFSQTSGISTVTMDDKANNMWYNLRGQRMMQPTSKGIYIQGSRKMILR